MATALEAIAEKLEAARKEKLETILSVSGSQSIAKNDYNVTIVDEQVPASSLLFKSLSKDKYDDVELVKAIDVEVRELKPNIPVPNRNLVPKPLYDEKVADNEDLRQQVTDLTDEVQTLTDTVSNLSARIQTEINSKLNIEQTNDVLLNQLDALNNTIQDFTTQIQSAVQKSVDESILRASLQSQNAGFKAQIEALIKQIDSLNSIIEGLQAQLGAVQQQSAITSGTLAQAGAAGADVINDVVIAKFTENADPAKPKLYGRIRNGGGNKWVNGKAISLINNDKQPVTVDISLDTTKGVQYITVGQSQVTLAPKENKEITLGINEGSASNLDSKKKKIGNSGTTDYEGPKLTISVTRSNGSKQNKTYESKMTKTHPDSF